MHETDQETGTLVSLYNQPVVHTTHSSRQFSLSRPIAASVCLFLGLLICLSTSAQTPAQSGQSSTAPDSGRILLVLPFNNRTGQPSLEWIREAAPEILSARFISAGFAPMSRPDRLYALDHLGLPQGFQPSRASSLKLAQTLDADSIVVGSYLTDGTAIIAEARLVDVPHLRMSELVSARGEMKDMLAVFDSLAWKLTRQLDPNFNGSEETFVAASRDLRLEAFEQYIRGISEPDQAERLTHLKNSVQLSPTLGVAWMALGREDYNSQKYEDAAAAFAKVGNSSSDALEAGFYRGLSLLFSGDYPHAEESFAAVAHTLPLAEVLNNQGVALSRQKKDAIGLFRQAVSADPNSADDHFNLALGLKRKGETAEALAELAQCLRLRPTDNEAKDLEDTWNAPKTDAAPVADPLERIARTFDASAFQQAAQMMDQMENARLAALGPQARALREVAQAREFLNHGLLLEAERLLLKAMAGNPRQPEAHAALAEVRERAGDAAAARQEATTSLELLPSVDAYMVLARLDVARTSWDLASREVNAALQIDGQNQAARDLKQQIEAGKAAIR